MQLPSIRARRALLARSIGAGLLCIAMCVGAATALAETPATTATPSRSICPYVVMAVSRFHPPIQSDPSAGYPMWILGQNRDATTPFDEKALVIHAEFPYAAWMAWSTYENANLFPYDVLNNVNIVPDRGSVNPFLAGTPVYARHRSYTLMVLPVTYESIPGDISSQPDYSRLPADLRGVKNVLYRPAKDTPIKSVTGATAGTEVTGVGTSVTERVYKAFPGYDRLGSFGPTDTPLPQMTAVSLTNGTPANCDADNRIPRAIQYDPTKPVTAAPALPGIVGSDGFGLGAGPRGSHSQYGPKPTPKLVEFFRPGLFDAPAPDVPSVPTPDSCSGYLGAQLNDREIALIRVPHVATFIDVNTLKPNSVFTPQQVSYISYNVYGSQLGVYRAGSPTSMGANDSDLRLDSTGGTTIVVWPRVGPYAVSRQLIVRIARSKGWTLEEGNVSGRVYGDKLFIRQKGTASDYVGGFTQNASRSGVPCFRDPAPVNQRKGLPIVPPSAPFSAVPEEYAAVPSELGASTPQGVECTLHEYVSGSCLALLKKHIVSTGGSYDAKPASFYKPPPWFTPAVASGGPGEGSQ